MELDKFDINACNEDLKTLPSSIKNNFNQIVEITNNAFKKLGMKTEEMSICYQRFANATSILAIKVSQGEDNDINNYMFNGCSAYNEFCNVYMHSEAKSAKKSMDIANLISRNIVSFFENVEQDLSKNNQSDMKIFIKSPLGKKDEQKRSDKKSSAKELIKSIFKK